MSLPPLWMVVDDEMKMANLYREEYLQRFGFNSNASFTYSLLLTIKNYRQNRKISSIIWNFWVLYNNLRFGKKIIEIQMTPQKKNKLYNSSRYLICQGETPTMIQNKSFTKEMPILSSY
jgi:hypothetical protein